MAQLGLVQCGVAWLGAGQSFPAGSSSPAQRESGSPARYQGQNQCHQHPRPAGTGGPRARPPPGQQGAAPGTCTVCHRGPGTGASCPRASPSTWTGQVRCEWISSSSLGTPRSGANNPRVIPTPSSAPRSSFTTRSGQHPAARLPSVIPRLRHGKPVPHSSGEALPHGARHQVCATSVKRSLHRPSQGGQSPLLSRFITQGNCCHRARFIKCLL